MKINRNQMLLSIGTLTIIILPMISVVACGVKQQEPYLMDSANPTDRGKFWSITEDMVKNVIYDELSPDPTKQTSDNPGQIISTINELDEVTIGITEWRTEPTLGSVYFKPTIWKDEIELFRPRTFSEMEITGFHKEPPKTPLDELKDIGPLALDRNLINKDNLIASDPKNIEAIKTEIKSNDPALFDELVRHLTFTGKLDPDEYNSIKVFYDGKVQDFTLEIGIA